VVSLVFYDRPRNGGDPAARTAGQHARGIVQRLRMRTLLTLGVLAVATALLGRGLGWRDPVFMGSEVALLVAIFVVSRWVLPLLDRHDRGAAGEEHVGALLAGLREGWEALHDVSLGRGNVDHIVLGPGGVFTIETKSNPGPVRVGSLHGGALAQAQAERRLVERVTGVHVEPLLVYSRAWVDRPLTRRRGVRVVPAGMLLAYVSRQPERLTGADVERARERLVGAMAALARKRRPRSRPRPGLALWDGSDADTTAAHRRGPAHP
jgi:hypothetical protein